MDGQTKKTRRAGRPSAEEAEQKLQMLLDTALQEFVNTGFHGASVRVIAERAKVSTRTVYNHYPDKIALFGACLDRISEEIEPQVIDNSGDIQGRLSGFVLKMQIQLFRDLNMQMARLIYREGLAFRELQEMARVQFYRYQVGPVARILRDNGVNGDDASELAAHFVVMALGKWQRVMIFGDPIPSEEAMKAHADQVTGVFLNGFNNLPRNY